MRRRDGLTMIELLLAVMMLGVLITVILAPLAGFFSLVRASDQTLSANTQVQEVVEAIRGQWQDRGRYDRTCLQGFALPQNVTLTIKALDRNSAEGATLSLNSCSANPPSTIPPIKRVTVRVTSADQQNQASVTLDIPRP